MKDFSNYIKKMGGLHDADIVFIDWDESTKILKIELDDIYANFNGLSEYPGFFSGVITFKGVTNLLINFKNLQPLRISYIENQQDFCAISFSPGGKIRFTFKSVNFPECLLVP